MIGYWLGLALDREQKQRVIVAAFAIIVVMCWPPDHGPNLLFRFVHWAVDPTDSLPTLPPALPPGMGDNGDAVAEHDAIEAEYYRLYNSSEVTRWRMEMKVAQDPFDVTFERQFLVAFAALGAFFAWALAKPTSST